MRFGVSLDCFQSAGGGIRRLLALQATVHRVGVIMNGVTGRMGTNQHLLRSIKAIIDQGGVRLSDRDRLRTTLASQLIRSPDGNAIWVTVSAGVVSIDPRMTREQLYQQLHEELPYDSAVRPESYTQRKDGSVEIHQQIVVGRDSQKPIVLGKRGARIKAIGEAARTELSAILGVPVHLYLHVKVDEKWAESREIYEEMGLDWVR